MAGKLKPLDVAREARPGKYPDGDGLYLIVASATSKNWSYRYWKDGKQRWLGLGSFKGVSLKDARLARDAARLRVKGDRSTPGVDIVQERREAREEQKASTALRRVAQLEERLGAQMFEILRSGYRPYRCGEEVLEFAVRMKASSNQLAARVFGLDQSLHGQLRVTVAPPSARSRSDETVGQQIKASFLASDRTYGARRVWRDLLADGVECGLHRIERLMRLQVLRARPRRLCFVLLCGEEAVQALGLMAVPFLSSG